MSFNSPESFLNTKRSKKEVMSLTDATGEEVVRILQNLSEKNILTYHQEWNNKKLTIRSI